MVQLTADDASILLSLTARWKHVYTITILDDIWQACCARTSEILAARSGPELRLILLAHSRYVPEALPVVQEDSASL